MWNRWIDLNFWPFWAFLLGLAASTLALAWSSYNLFDLAIANANFITTYGTMALLDGGLRQLLEITLYGIVSLISYVAFRGFDTEIIERWREIGKK